MYVYIVLLPVFLHPYLFSHRIDGELAVPVGVLEQVSSVSPQSGLFHFQELLQLVFSSNLRFMAGKEHNQSGNQYGLTPQKSSCISFLLNHHNNILQLPVSYPLPVAAQMCFRPAVLHLHTTLYPCASLQD